MKSVLIASSLALALASGSALAADMGLPVKAPIAPAPPPAPSWTGCYVNAGVGYGFWNQQHYEEDLPSDTQLTATVNTGGEGWLGRFGGGCDYQIMPSFTIGVFGDYDIANINGTLQGTLLAVNGNENLSSEWAVGGRVGYVALPGLLAFFEGGYTQARFDQVNFSTTIFPSIAAPYDLAAQTYNGWFIGGGYEYALTWLPVPGLFWKTEYRYSTYQAADIPIIITPTGTPFGYGEHVQKDVQTITSSLVWRFNWTGAPLATRY